MEKDDKEVFYKPLSKTVFPSTATTIRVKNDEDYGGAHEYSFLNSLGHQDGEPVYAWDEQNIQFVKRNEDGSMVPGVQSEQLIIALIDRHKKLNAKFPSREGALAITKLQEALFWLEQRVVERIDRGVMGKLEK